MALERTVGVYFSRQGVKHTAVDADVVKFPYNAFKVTTASDTAPRDSVRSGGSGDADDFWKDYYLVAVNTLNVPEGESRRVTGWANATGEATVASAFSATVAAGDIFAFWKKASPNALPTFGPEINEITRNVLGGGLDPALPAAIVTGATASFTAHVMGVASYPAADTKIKAPPMGDLIRAAMGRVSLDAPSTVSGAASTVRSVNIPTAKHEQFSIGGAVVIQDVNSTGLILDEGRWIVGKADGGAGVDSLQLKPDLTVAPATAGKKVFGAATFGLVSESHPRVTLAIFIPDGSTAGREVILRSCLANMTIGQDSSNLLEMTFTFSAAEIEDNSLAAGHFSRTITDSLVNEEPTFGPVKTIDGEFSFRTASAATADPATYSGTTRDIRNFSLDTGNVVSKRATMASATGVASVSITGRNPQISLGVYLQGGTPDVSDLLGAVVKDFQIQLGGQKQSGGTDKRSIFMLRVPYARITAVNPGTTEGEVSLDFTLQATKDLSEGFEDLDKGDAGLHNSPAIQDSYRIAIV